MLASMRVTSARQAGRLLTLVLVGGLSLVLLVLPITAASAATCAASYTVQPGDNLYRIGLKYGLAWPRLAEVNNLANPRVIFPGQVLCIPDTQVTPSASATPAPTGQPQPAGQPTVQPGAVPAITIISVLAGRTVTIQAVNFPPHQTLNVLMGKNGSLGIKGTLVTTQDTGPAASFTATYAIPAPLAPDRVIAIRLENSAGYYSYGWFSNQVTP